MNKKEDKRFNPAPNGKIKTNNSPGRQKKQTASPTRSNQQSISPMLKPIDSYLNDINDSYTDLRSDSSAIISDIEKISQNFNTRVKSHYRYLVKLLPILIIFLPSLLKIFFPEIIKFGHFEIGDQKNNPSTILIDFFSILLICWIVKFLLDWPWKWYTQINEIKQKLYTMLESSIDAEDVDKDFQNRTNQNLTILKIQHTLALIMCVLSPFLSGILLLFSRDYIVVIGNDDGTDKSLIFSDLNIGIFVSCGIIRVVIQISEHIQQSTASIEIDTEKFIMDHNHRNLSRIDMLDHNNEEKEGMVLDRLTKLETQFQQLSKKFDAFHNNNRLTNENNLTFLSSKHFKILEKEINELHYKLDTRTNDLENKISLMFTTSHPSGGQDQLVKSQHSSLHGIPLSPMKPSYSRSTPSSNNSFFPVDQYNKFTKQLPSPLSKLGSIFPIFNNEPSTSPDIEHKSNEIAIKELSNLDALNKYNLGSRPIVEYLINFPFFFQKLIWKMVSYVPLSVLKGIYIILLSILDALLTKVNEQNHEDDEMNVKLGQRDPIIDESFEEIISR